MTRPRAGQRNRPEPASAGLATAGAVASLAAVAERGGLLLAGAY